MVHYVITALPWCIERTNQALAELGFLKEPVKLPADLILEH